MATIFTKRKDIVKKIQKNDKKTRKTEKQKRKKKIREKKRRREKKKKEKKKKGTKRKRKKKKRMSVIFSPKAVRGVLADFEIFEILFFQKKTTLKSFKYSIGFSHFFIFLFFSFFSFFLFSDFFDFLTCLIFFLQRSFFLSFFVFSCL